MKRGAVLKELTARADGAAEAGHAHAFAAGTAAENETESAPASWWHVALYRWIRWVIPGAILAVGIWWLLTDVIRVVPAL
jgi:hypothetical protein